MSDDAKGISEWGPPDQTGLPLVGQGGRFKLPRGGWVSLWSIGKTEQRKVGAGRNRGERWGGENGGSGGGSAFYEAGWVEADVSCPKTKRLLEIKVPVSHLTIALHCDALTNLSCFLLLLQCKLFFEDHRRVTGASLKVKKYKGILLWNVFILECPSPRVGHALEVKNLANCEISFLSNDRHMAMQKLVPIFSCQRKPIKYQIQPFFGFRLCVVHAIMKSAPLCRSHIRKNHVALTLLQFLLLLNSSEVPTTLLG